MPASVKPVRHAARRRAKFTHGVIGVSLLPSVVGDAPALLVAAPFANLPRNYAASMVPHKGIGVTPPALSQPSRAVMVRRGRSTIVASSVVTAGTKSMDRRQFGKLERGRP